MKLFDQKLFKTMAVQARINPRLRQHFNFHQSYDEPSQRLLNAMQPGSYIRPHRHWTDPKSECFIALKGLFALFIFDDQGFISDKIVFGLQEDTLGADIPAWVWHTVICLQEDSIFFETKPGPFNPINKKDLALWAPEEGSHDGILAEKLLADIAKGGALDIWNARLAGINAATNPKNSIRPI